MSGVAPLEVEFTDLSVGYITSWAWDFGDGATSTDENPVHTYTAAGEYTVILVVSDGNVSYTEEKTGYIYVTEGCLPGLQGTYYDEYNSQYQIPFSGTPEQRVDLRIWFADSASGEESDEANWPVATIGKANTFSVVYEGNLIVPKDESYTFHLRSDDGSVLWIDNTADTDPVLINNWGLHAATTVSASKFLAKGKHPIRIKMMENNGDAVLHLEWESATIPLQPVESFCHGTGTLLNAEFDATPLNGTRPLNVQFTDHSTGTITSWLWDFGDGSSSVLQNPAHIYTNSGQYTVSLYVTDDTSSDTETKDQYINVTGMPSPVAWWRFDEVSGLAAIDSSDNGNDGTILGGVADRRAGACGTGLYFNGTTTWVNVPDDVTLSFNDTFTFAGWFRPEVPELLPGQGNEFQYFTQIIGKGYDDYQNHEYSNNYEIFLRIQNNLLQFEANGDTDASSDQAFTSDASGLPVSYNDWFHLAVVVDGGVGLVYVDGNLVGGGFSVDRTPLKENSEPVSIGKQIVSIDWAEFYYKGMMDELYLFGSVLTPDEISSLTDTCTPTPWEAPEVSFSAAPVTGDAPLDVQFTSTVTGTAPFTYAWTFGDGTTSTEQNPVHTYASAGTYSVSLTVTNAVGTDTATQTDLVVVNPVIPLLDIELNTDPDKPGYIETGGVFTFSVNGLYSFVEINSNIIDLNSGDAVEIRVVDSAQANLYMNAASISSFNLADATLVVNNVERETGQITDIWISSYSLFDSTADLIVPKKNKWTRLTVDGSLIINSRDKQVIRLNAIQPGSSGVMNLNLEGTDVYYSGGAEGYLVSN